MKPLFEDYQVRVFSHNDKIEWVFKKLLAELKPTTLSRKVETSWYHNGHRGSYEIIIAECHKIKTTIKVPFPDISLSIKEDCIIIKGENFKYEFASNMILTVWTRLQKQIR
jgi:hypothetical protein